MLVHLRRKLWSLFTKAQVKLKSATHNLIKRPVWKKVTAVLSVSPHINQAVPLLKLLGGHKDREIKKNLKKQYRAENKEPWCNCCHSRNISESIKRSLRSLLCLSLSVGVYSLHLSAVTQQEQSIWVLHVSQCLFVCVGGCMWLTPRGYKYSYTKQGWKEAAVWYFLILTRALPRWNCFWCAFEALPSSKSLVHEVSVVFYLISFPTWRQAEERGGFCAFVFREIGLPLPIIVNIIPADMAGSCCGVRPGCLGYIC